MPNLSPHKKIIELVDENYTLAKVLHSFGIKFYKHSEQTLETICKSCSLGLDQLAKRLDELENNREIYLDENLQVASITVILQYLRHAHHVFVRYKLPYMNELIANVQPKYFTNRTLAKDLKFIFPHFVEDFVKHIYEEEDTLFSHIMKLQQAVKGDLGLYDLYKITQKYSIEAFAEHHMEEDDEMDGIRALTNNYHMDEHTTVYTKVIYCELIAFEKDLAFHSRVENHILFPKALELEKEVNHQLNIRAGLN
ncbi:iron-sulfur cluster repair di-iron protein [Rapidithrix thailandica]|uniref:Iron-sulfur cluster repair di-iron protein n=1 Tax=Rapidithrix thailandica TaxID=413964 RepID=A0AAW9S584_9BACT